jgi:hypothetical protein
MEYVFIIVENMISIEGVTILMIPQYIGLMIGI